MVRAWFMDDDVASDQRLEHHRAPPEFVELTKLFELTGVEYFKVSGKRGISDVGWSGKSISCSLQMTFRFDKKRRKLHSNAHFTE